MFVIKCTDTLRFSPKNILSEYRAMCGLRSNIGPSTFFSNVSAQKLL